MICVQQDIKLRGKSMRMRTNVDHGTANLLQVPRITQANPTLSLSIHPATALEYN